MSIYNTNVAKSYAAGAGFGTPWSGIREILQNALDGRDRGYYMRIDHGKARDRSGAWALKVVNEGVTLTRDALVLGFSTKTNDDTQRGQHGEGLIVGINALLNNGYEVWIRTGDEAWIAKHQTNENGLDLLVIDIRKQPKKINDFIVEIKGVTPEDWASYKDRMLFFNEEDRRIEVGEGTILLDRKYRNQLFVKGIFVGNLPDDYQFGYDISVHLNRDREVAEPWELRRKVRDVIAQALAQDLFTTEDVTKVLDSDGCGEALAFSEDYWYDAYGISQKIAEDFIDRHGIDAVPVCSVGDAQRAEHFGKKGITVAQAVKKIIEKHSGKLEDRLAETALNVSKRYNWVDLSAQEKQNIENIVRIVRAVEEDSYFDKLQIVDFVGEKIRGTAKTVGNVLQEICIARRICNDKTQLLKTFVHEVAHKFAADGDHEHDEQQCRILAEIVVSQME